MITFRILANDLGTSEIFLIDGRRSGFIAYNVFNGTWTVYFSDMADALPHVALERLDQDGGIYRLSPAVSGCCPGLVPPACWPDGQPAGHLPQDSTRVSSPTPRTTIRRISGPSSTS